MLGYGDYLDYEAKINQLQEQETHFVRWGAADPKYPGISVGSNNYQGGYMVTEHLISQGRTRFAFVGEAGTHAPEFLARFQGFTHALSQADLMDQFVGQFDAIFTVEAGLEAALELFAEGERPDAIVCASDLIALGVIQAMRQEGLRCPEDIAVTGFDNIPIAGLVEPALTTVQQDTKAAGITLVEHLLKHINNENTSDTLIPASLIIRDSSKPLTQD